MRTWIIVTALLVASVGAQASHFGWRRVDVGGTERGIVASHGMDLFEISTRAGGYSPARRAEIIAGRLEELSESHDLSPQMLSVGFRNGMVIIQQQEHAEHLPHIVATIDPEMTRRCMGASGSAERLAHWRLALLRDHVSLAIGRLPVYTSGTPITDTFRKLFEQLDISGDSVRSEDIDRAFAKLPESNRELFRRAACTVPESFNPDRVIVIQPPTGRRSEPVVGKENKHHDDADGEKPTTRKPDSTKPPVPDFETPAGAPTVRAEPSRDTEERPEDHGRSLKQRHDNFEVGVGTRPTPLRAGGESIVEVFLIDTSSKSEPGRSEPRPEGRPLTKAAITAWFVPEGGKESDVEPRSASPNPDMAGLYGWGIRFAKPGRYRFIIEVVPPTGKKFKVEFPLKVSPE